jgi:four helix bundle protein
VVNRSAKTSRYSDLIAWQKAMELVEQIYRVSTSWPKDEQYGLTSQVRRAAVSVPANIAEGQGRTGSREFAHHLSIAQGSLAELETLPLIAQRLRYCEATDGDALLARAAEISRLVGGLLRSVRAAQP